VTGNIGVLDTKGTKVSPLPTFGSISFSSVEVNSSPTVTRRPQRSTITKVRRIGSRSEPLTDGGSAFVNTQES
jgi:hypothetical protein